MPKKRHVMTITRTLMLAITPLPIDPLNIGKGINAGGIRGDDAVLDSYLMADHFLMSQPTNSAHR